MPEEKWDRILGRGEKCEGYPYINTPENYQSESGAGGLKTTVDDMTNLGLMLLNGGIFNGKRIMSRHSIREMTRNHNTDCLYYGIKSFAAWGLGWNVKAGKKDDAGLLRSDSSIDHSGFGGTKFVIDPEENITAAIFSAEYKFEQNTYRNIQAPIINVLYSALE